MSMAPRSTPAAPPDALRLAPRATRAQPSMILGINARAKQLQAQGRDVVLFGAGEPDFQTPAHIRRATAEALERGLTRYTASAGIVELRAAVADTYSRERGVAYSAEDVIVTTGAKMSLFEVFQATCDVGDEVIVCGPYWGSYLDIIGLSGATPVVVPTDEASGFAPDPDRIAAALTPRTRAVLLNTPGNPTGAVLDGSAIERLARVLEGTGVLVVCDEIYEKILYDGARFRSLSALPGWRERCVVIGGVSKTYSMTGFRIGWTLGPRSLIQAMGRIQDQSTSGPTAFAQAGALAAVTGPHDFVAPMVAEYQRRRDCIVAGLRTLPGVTCVSPAGAFYALASIDRVLGRTLDGERIDTSARLCELMLERFGVALVPGEPFGAPRHMRLSFATSLDQIERGLSKLQSAFALLQ